jgi:hypothetical protein
MPTCLSRTPGWAAPPSHCGSADAGNAYRTSSYLTKARPSPTEAVGAEALLLGRRSDEWFGSRWSARSDEWADRLNSLPKYVVSSVLEALLTVRILDDSVDRDVRAHHNLSHLGAPHVGLILAAVR